MIEKGFIKVESNLNKIYFQLSQVKAKKTPSKFPLKKVLLLNLSLFIFQPVKTPNRDPLRKKAGTPQ